MLYTLDLLGTIVFAASGALLAHEQRKNIVQAMFYAVLTALGGGTIRDLILPYHPIFWLVNPTYVWLAIVSGLLMFGLMYYWPLRCHHLYWADTLSMATFTVIGAQAVLSSPKSVFTGWVLFLIPLAGLLTTVGGGILRDMLSLKVPAAICDPLYPLASLLGGLFYSIAMGLHLADLFAIGIVFIAVFAMRAVANDRKIRRRRVMGSQRWRRFVADHHKRQMRVLP